MIVFGLSVLWMGSSKRPVWHPTNHWVLFPHACILPSLGCRLSDVRTRVLDLHASHPHRLTGCKKNNPPDKIYDTLAEVIITVRPHSTTLISCRGAENRMHKHVLALIRDFDSGGIQR